MDENLSKVTDEFMNQRINYHGKNEPEALTSAFMELRAGMDRLRETMPDEQARLLRSCENAYRVADGETRWFFYKAGFSDAIRFLMGFGAEG